MVDYNDILTYDYVRDKHNSIRRCIERQFGTAIDFRFQDVKDEVSLLVKDVQKHLLTQYPLSLAKKILMCHRFEILVAFYLAVSEGFNNKYCGDNACGHELTMVPTVPELFDKTPIVKTNGRGWIEKRLNVENCDSMVLFGIHPKKVPKAITRFVVESVGTHGRQKTVEFTENSFKYEFNGLPLHMFSHAIVCERGDSLHTKVYFNGNIDKAEVAIGGHREEINIGGLAFLKHKEYRSYVR